MKHVEIEKEFTPYKIVVKTQEMHDFLRYLTNLHSSNGCSSNGSTCNNSLNQGLANALDSEEVK